MYDILDNVLTSVSPSGIGGVPYLAKIRINCLTGQFLRVEQGTVDDFDVEGKFEEDVSYVSLEGAGLDLSPYNGDRKTIDLRFTPIAVSVKTLFDFNLIVE